MNIKIYRNLIYLVAVIVFITTLSELPLTAESIFLKDGSIFNGTIVSASDETITIRMDDSELKQIPRKNILKILYTKLKTTTKNIRPDKPLIISVEKVVSNDRKITWLASTDPDGIVTKYRIYGTVGDMRKMIGESKSTEYLLKNALSYDRVELAAVDDKETESDSVKVNIYVENAKTLLGFYPGIILPLGKSGKICNTGYGGMLTLTRTNIFTDGVEAGLSGGFYYANGKDLLDEGKPLYHRFIIAPLLINAGYRLEFWKSFSIIPSFSFGASFIHIKFMRRDVSSPEDLELSGVFIDPTLKAGLSLAYNITESISISLLGEYGMFIEMGGSIPFVTSSLGIEYRF